MPLVGWAFLASVALYALTVVGFSLSLAARQGMPRLLAWLPAVFVTVHAGAAVGVWWELLAGGKAPPAG